MSLVIITGPMFSGKTTRLITEYQKYVHFNASKAILIKPTFDTREKGVKSHLDIENDAIQAHSLSDVILTDQQFVGIDEMQFFGDDSFDMVIEWAKTKTVFVAILKDKKENNGTFNLGKLVQNADRIILLKSVCRICGQPAAFTKKKANFNPLVPDDYVGGDDKYYPVCRQHK